MITLNNARNHRRSLQLSMVFLFAALSWGAASGQTEETAANEPAVAVKEPAPRKVAALLTPVNTITGLRLGSRPKQVLTIQSGMLQMPAIPRMPDPNGYLTWMMPTLVAARNNFMYVVDGGRRQIFQVDLAQQSMSAFAQHAAAGVSAIALAPDMSVYIADTTARQVFHFSFDGRLLQTFANEQELVRPVAVILDELSGRVFVADSSYNHVVVFDSLGHVLAVLRSDEARSIEAMARGPDGFYLLDRLSKQVVVMSEDGRDKYSFGKDDLKMPGAIAVDRYNRVFVSDNFDNTIKIFENSELAAVFGGSGSTNISFNRVSGLWLEKNTLYAADSANARILSFRVARPGVKDRARE